MEDMFERRRRSGKAWSPPIGGERAASLVELQGIVDTLMESQRESARTIDAQREAIQRLRADNRRESLLSSASHDLRTPLTVILGCAETLRGHGEKLPPLTRLEMTERVIINARRIDHRLGDLLTLDRMRRQQLTPDIEQIDVDELLSSIIAASGIGQGRAVTVSRSPLTLRADASLLTRALMSLFENVVRHTPPGTPVWVSASSTVDSAEITISDAGPGVDPAHRSNVFNRFFESEVGEDSPRAGVGLAVVSAFARVHGGRAWVSEREGGGASFHILLPIGAREPAGEPDHLPPLPAPEVSERVRTL